MMINLNKLKKNLQKKRCTSISDHLIGIKDDLFLFCIFVLYIKYNQRKSIILQLKTDPTDLIGERDLPGSPKFLKNDWWKVMLLRYGLAMYYSKGKTVLDTCSGLGWGAYLLEGVAKCVTCIELDTKCIHAANKLWKCENTDYLNASVLKMPVKKNYYDVVTAMESIEHFNLVDMEIYLKEIYDVLKPEGIVIGSSAFTETRDEAEKLCSRNIYHKHICTQNEIKEILIRQGFNRIKIFKNRLFFMARK